MRNHDLNGSIIMPHRTLIQTTLLFFISLFSIHAQFASDVEWFKIETEHFLVIFPFEIAEEARQIALKSEEIYRREALDFDVPREKHWPLILTTSGMDSNGYVSLAPRKSVWFGTPSGEGMSALGWYDLLGLHEIRHMVQLDSMNRGFIRLLYILGGELGLTAGIHLSVPSWFLEGDAVGAETRYSPGGRGRDPLFYSQMKILTLNKDFSYQKYVNRSYRDYIPNQYVFGYFMTSYIRRTYGEESWNQILKRTSFFPLPAFGIYLGAKKVTGKSWSTLFDEMMKELRETWSEEDRQIDLIPNTRLFETPRDNYTSYETIYADGDTVLARKTSLAEPSVLVSISGGRERVLFRISSEGTVTSNGKSAVWTYLKPSALYESRSWSDLVAADLDTGHKTIISRKTRYLSPSFSPDGQLLAVVSFSTSGHSEIQIFETLNWEVQKTFPVPDFPSGLSWSEDGKALFFTLQGRPGRGIFSLNLSSGTLIKILDYSLETVKRVYSWKNYLIYSSPETGFENIMALEIETEKKYQVSSRPYGVMSAYLSTPESRIYYSDILDEKGSVIAWQELNPEDWIPLNDIIDSSGPYSGEGMWSVQDLQPSPYPGDEPRLEIEKYRMREGRFSLHSWGIAPNLETTTGLRFQIQTTDLMGTLNMAAGSEYEINDETWGAFFDLDWKQFYPVISLRNNMTPRTLSGVDLWDGSFRMGISFPVTLRRDVWYYGINPGISGGLRTFIPVDGQDSQTYFPVSTFLGGYALLPGSFRSINPDWGLVQRTGAGMNPEKASEYYRIFSDTRLYAPGLLRNCSLSLNGAFEEQTGQYSLSFPFARGFAADTDFRTVKGSVDYDFPLFYPDLAGGSFFYISRIRGKLFYDFVHQEDRGGDASRMQSTGGELIFDLTAANQSQGPFSLGLRYSWLPDEKRPVIQLVFINAAL